ncbi:MAG: stage III sporulation protein AF [Bacillota bacterium]
MAFLYQWVHSLAVIVFMAALLEMLIPRSSLNRYVRVVMGLLILLATIQPLLTLLGQGIDLDALTGRIAATSSRGLEAIMARGAELREARAQEAIAQYRSMLEADIEGYLAGLSANRFEASVELIITEGRSTGVRRIVIWVLPPETVPDSEIHEVAVEVEAVAIEIGEPDGTSASNTLDPQLAAKIRELLSAAYRVRLDQIEVKTKSEG